MDQSEIDFSSFPSEEDDRYEYKSGQSSARQIKTKLAKAASAFWNSGGGHFVVGVDDHGQPDEGFDPEIGNQSIRDWVDQIVHTVQPVGKYDIAKVTGEVGDTLVVRFKESAALPHMAPDGRYYVRAGAHTVRAGHFLVEALRSRRGIGRPYLQTTLRPKPDFKGVVQLGILSLSESAALNVEVDLNPIPHLWTRLDEPLPLKLGVIDRSHPFFLDLTFTAYEDQEPDAVTVTLRYEDLLGKEYQEELAVDLKRGIGPWELGSDQTARHLKDIRDHLKRLEKSFTDFAQHVKRKIR